MNSIANRRDRRQPSDTDITARLRALFTDYDEIIAGMRAKARRILAVDRRHTRAVSIPRCAPRILRAGRARRSPAAARRAASDSGGGSDPDPEPRPSLSPDYAFGGAL